jgi:predicted neutral ceramidase superfamily lipid hydrolase
MSKIKNHKIKDNLYKNVFLADLVFIFHCLIVAFVLFAPFTNIPSILILHITFSISLFVHWYANSNVCSLTILEGNLRGLDRTDTFTHQFIGPVYDISTTEWSNIVWYITVFIMCVSIYKLYNTDKFKTAWGCYQQLSKEETSWTKAFECFKPLFLI